MSRFKVATFFLLLLFAFTIAEAQNKTIRENNGTDWLSRSDSYRVGFVAGFIAGSLLMCEETLGGLARQYEGEEFKKAPPGIRFPWQNAMTKSDELALVEISVGQITDGLNIFYDDFSTRKIKVIDAIYVVKMQINGKNPDLISAQIRYLKMQPLGADDLIIVIDKLDLANDFGEALKAGKITEEELLKAGFFVDKNGEQNVLFRYGKY